MYYDIADNPKFSSTIFRVKNEDENLPHDFIEHSSFATVCLVWNIHKLYTICINNIMNSAQLKYQLIK